MYYADTDTCANDHADSSALTAAYALADTRAHTNSHPSANTYSNIYTEDRSPCTEDAGGFGFKKQNIFPGSWTTLKMRNPEKCLKWYAFTL